MISKNNKKIFAVIGLAMLFGVFAIVAYADHSWGSYHWGRKANPFTVKLGDNVSSAWDSYLGTTASDWSVSSVLDATVVAGSGCKPSNGRVEVCSASYGNTGWLGIAQIWVKGTHITKGLAKMNDTYFNTASYSTPGWRNLVMCQEVGHTFGLAHQDETFANTNLGSCMDYTNDPDGTLKNQLSNEHPNAHDYTQLGTIYAHLDSVSTLSQVFAGATHARNNDDIENSAEWGRGLRQDGQGRTSLYERDLGNGEKLFTFVIWVD